MLLNRLTQSPEVLPGVGPRRAQRLRKLGITTVGELLTVVPRRYEDRSQVVSLVEAARRGEGVAAATVIAHDFFPRGRERVLKIIIQDESATAVLVCFGRGFLAKTFPPGTELRVWGQFALRYGEIQSSTFEAEPHPLAAPYRGPALMPVYPLTDGINQTQMRDIVSHAVKTYAAEITDELPDDLRERVGLMTLPDALTALHHPRTSTEPTEAFKRLVWGELFVFQLRLALQALRRRRSRRRARPGAMRHLKQPLVERLPFSLTDDQNRVLDEIINDMEQPWPMSRLFQGDVGSGKTLVALLAALHAVERGTQVALMVPTELLARQHARNIGALLTNLDVHPALALGSMPTAARRELAAALRDGDVDLLIGTHALFSQGMEYANLGLVIIDEQHRFGVGQREELIARGNAPDILMMSATPIPRSLALTAFGDSDVSTIHTLPPGRKPIKTHLARMGNDERVYAFLRRELDAGHQAYLVYPAIDEGGAKGYRSAEEMFRRLTTVLAPHEVGMAHSRMDDGDRAATMERFSRGEVRALVATSVVEVGVDVADATCMVVEHAESFGLAALHQLRGRVGRGADQAYCILVYQEPLSDDARERLRVMYESTDGFAIAEEDLRIRGPGELHGQRQSGFLDFRFADIRVHMKEMIAAREEVARLLRDDPELSARPHEALRAEVERLTEEETT